ncbi:18723_t:CDS:2, partial [Gigaspora rosea]
MARRASNFTSPPIHAIPLCELSSRNESAVSIALSEKSRCEDTTIPIVPGPISQITPFSFRTTAGPILS